MLEKPNHKRVEQLKRKSREGLQWRNISSTLVCWKWTL